MGKPTNTKTELKGTKEETPIEFGKKQKVGDEMRGHKAVSSSKTEQITVWSMWVPPEEKGALAQEDQGLQPATAGNNEGQRRISVMEESR